MPTIPKWTIEIKEVDGGGTYTTVVRRGAADVTTGTPVTVPNGNTATGRIHEAVIKGALAVFNDRAAGN
jgi:hypothetical protein